MIVLFRGTGFPDAGNDYILEFLDRKDGSTTLLPVALDVHHRRPPAAAEAFKSLPYDAKAKGPTGRLANRIGAMLGLRVRPAENKIFISYSGRDGVEIAKRLYEHLTELKYNPWMDEAREVDDETKILPGSLVQEEIDNALSDASVVLLVDTPAAPHSKWIKHEVDTANASLLPILPLCFRAIDDHNKGPRFRSLLALQRWVPLQLSGRPIAVAPAPAELDVIVSEMENFLSEIFQRKCRVPFLVRKEFISREFAWETLDERLLIFGSVKKHSPRLATKVVTHCSIFERIHAPALQRFCDFLVTSDRPNYSLYLYDGEVIPEPELAEFIHGHDQPVLILHHQELAVLLDSNFTVLAA